MISEFFQKSKGNSQDANAKSQELGVSSVSEMVTTTETTLNRLTQSSLKLLALQGNEARANFELITDKMSKSLEQIKQLSQKVEGLLVEEKEFVAPY